MTNRYVARTYNVNSKRQHVRLGYFYGAKQAKMLLPCAEIFTARRKEVSTYCMIEISNRLYS